MFKANENVYSFITCTLWLTLAKLSARTCSAFTSFEIATDGAVTCLPMVSVANTLPSSPKKEAQNVELTPEMEEEPDANSPYDQMIHDERMNIINRLVNELPEKQRLIMQLRDIEGESYKKIAGLLNLTEEQVKVNLFRARQKVKQRYLEIDEYGL